MKPGVDYIGVGVGAIIIDDKGRLFMARRGPQAGNERGLWEFPGGSVDYGERLADAIRREIQEEYGVDIEVASWSMWLTISSLQRTSIGSLPPFSPVLLLATL
jgi:mutator protein MutT